MFGVFCFLRMKFQLPRLVRLPFLSSAPGVEALDSRDRPRCSVDPTTDVEGSSSVMSPVGVPVGVVASPGPPLPLRLEKIDVDLVFQASNLLLLALRVILEMNVGFEAGVDSRLPDGPTEGPERPDVVRSSDSRLSIVDVVSAMEGWYASLLFRGSGGELLSVPSSFSFDLSFFSTLSLFFPKPNMVNVGALGLSFGVAGRCCCEEVGLVPIGACKGRVSRLGPMYSPSSSGCSDRFVCDPKPSDGRRE